MLQLNARIDFREKNTLSSLIVVSVILMFCSSRIRAMSPSLAVRTFAFFFKPYSAPFEILPPDIVSYSRFCLLVK